MSLDVLIWIFIAIIGLCLGSFYNVVILRGLSGESIVFPGSKCPKCGNALKWWHNIPLFSYLLLKGKCGFCKSKISLQYPIIELATMVIFITTYYHWGLDYKIIFVCAIFSLFLITAITDLKERVILTRHAYTLCAIGIIYSIFATFYPEYSLYEGQNPILASLYGILTGAGVMELLARMGYIFARQRAFGEGDSYIAGAIGAVLGWKYILWVLLIGFLIQFIASLPIFLFNLFKTGRAKIGLELLLFLSLATLLWYYGSYLTANIYSCSVALIALMAIHLARHILTNIKTNSTLTYLPYVPALVIAATTVIWVVY